MFSNLLQAPRSITKMFWPLTLLLWTYSIVRVSCRMGKSRWSPSGGVKKKAGAEVPGAREGPLLATRSSCFSLTGVADTWGTDDSATGCATLRDFATGDSVEGNFATGGSATGHSSSEDFSENDSAAGDSSTGECLNGDSIAGGSAAESRGLSVVSLFSCCLPSCSSSPTHLPHSWPILQGGERWGRGGPGAKWLKKMSSLNPDSW